MRGNRVRASDQIKLVIRARVGSSLDAVAHFFGRDDFFAWAVTATLGAHLVFDVAAGRAELDQALNRASDVERGRAKACVDVDDQGRIAHIGDATHIGQDIIKRIDAEVRQAKRACSDTAAREIDGPKAGALGQQGVVGVDGANDLQRLFGSEGIAKALSCRGLA